MIVCYNANGQYHAATSQGLICYGLPSEAALKAAISRVVDGDFTISYATPEVWRATMLAAVAADTLAAQSFIDSSDASREVDRLRAQLAMVLEAVEILNAELAAEGERAKAEEACRQAAAAEAKRVSQQQVAAKKAAAHQADEARWLDTRVIRDGDVVEAWRDVRECTGSLGPVGNRVPQFREYSQRVASWPVDQCPPHVLARIGKPPQRSKVYIPDSAQ